MLAQRVLFIRPLKLRVFSAAIKAVVLMNFEWQKIVLVSQATLNYRTLAVGYGYCYYAAAASNRQVPW